MKEQGHGLKFGTQDPLHSGRGAKAQRREQPPRVTCGGSGSVGASQTLRTYPTVFVLPARHRISVLSCQGFFLVLAPSLITQ